MGTHDWSKRLNLSLLSMCIVDTWLAFHGCRGGTSCPTTQREFCEDLAEQLIDNSYNGLVRQNRDSATSSRARVPTNDHSSGIDAHLTTTKRKKRTREGIATKYTMQGRCMDGVPYSRERWRQVDVTTPNAPPERVELTIPQPKAAEIYYSTCASIDHHNCA